jgi:glucokinase
MSASIVAIDVGGTKLDVATAALDTDAAAGTRQAIARAISSARATPARTAEATGGR